jgi:Zn-dependent protease with chaperone function
MPMGYKTIFPYHLLIIGLILRIMAYLLWLFLFVFVLFLGYSLLETMSSSGRVYFAPFIGIAICLYTIFKATKAMFNFHPFIEEAILIKHGEFKIIDDVINKIISTLNTRRPDHIVLGMTGNFYVAKGKFVTLNNERINGKILHLSIPLLRILNEKEIEAILFHEFGHFTGGDLIYSIFVAPVYRSLNEGIGTLWANFKAKLESIYSIAVRIMYIPPLIILWIYNFGFKIIDRGISRKRETRADYIAIKYCGKEVFAKALVKVIAYGTLFDGIKINQYKEVLSEDKMFVNYIEYFISMIPYHTSKIEKIIDSFFDKGTNLFSTHPHLEKRLKGLGISRDSINKLLDSNGSNINLNKIEEMITPIYGSFIKGLLGWEGSMAG